MGLFKEKKVYVATTIVYDEEAKRITVTGIISVHKSFESAYKALRARGYSCGMLVEVIDDLGLTMDGHILTRDAHVLYNPKTLEEARIWEMTLEK